MCDFINKAQVSLLSSIVIIFEVIYLFWIINVLTFTYYISYLSLEFKFNSFTIWIHIIYIWFEFKFVLPKTHAFIEVMSKFVALTLMTNSILPMQEKPRSHWWLTQFYRCKRNLDPFDSFKQTRENSPDFLCMNAMHTPVFSPFCSL
jgi:hypothetical protein